MKKYLLLVFTAFIFIHQICFSASMIDNVEKFLYGFTYQNQDETSRLNRIEQTVYGSTTKQTNAQKLARLKKDMASDLIGQEIPPVKDTFMEEDDKLAVEEKIAPGSNIDYPVINAMEKQVFNQEFKTNDVNGRLAKLEQKTFGKTFNDDLNTRVDRLRSKIDINSSIASKTPDYFDDEITLSDNSDMSSMSFPDPDEYDFYNSRKNIAPKIGGAAPVTERYSGNASLNAVEKALFKQTYPSDPTQNRLARLESSMFGTTFDSDPQDIRMNRISSAFNAQKSSKKYDSNKFTQNMATAFQIGTLILMVLACIL